MRSTALPLVTTTVAISLAVKGFAAPVAVPVGSTIVAEHGGAQMRDVTAAAVVDAGRDDVLPSMMERDEDAERYVTSMTSGGGGRELTPWQSIVGRARSGG